MVRRVTGGSRGRAAAPTGKDADPQECPWHFKGRGRSLSVIDVRHLESAVARRATTAVYSIGAVTPAEDPLEIVGPHLTLRDPGGGPARGA